MKQAPTARDDVSQAKQLANPGDTTQLQALLNNKTSVRVDLLDLLSGEKPDLRVVGPASGRCLWHIAMSSRSTARRIMPAFLAYAEAGVPTVLFTTTDKAGNTPVVSCLRRMARADGLAQCCRNKIMEIENNMAKKRATPVVGYLAAQKKKTRADETEELSKQQEDLAKHEALSQTLLENLIWALQVLATEHGDSLNLDAYGSLLADLALATPSGGAGTAAAVDSAASAEAGDRVDDASYKLLMAMRVVEAILKSEDGMEKHAALMQALCSRIFVLPVDAPKMMRQKALLTLLAEKCPDQFVAVLPAMHEMLQEWVVTGEWRAEDVPLMERLISSHPALVMQVVKVLPLTALSRSRISHESWLAVFLKGDSSIEDITQIVACVNDKFDASQAPDVGRGHASKEDFKLLWSSAFSLLLDRLPPVEAAVASAAGDTEAKVDAPSTPAMDVAAYLRGVIFPVIARLETKKDTPMAVVIARCKRAIDTVDDSQLKTDLAGEMYQACHRSVQGMNVNSAFAGEGEADASTENRLLRLIMNPELSLYAGDCCDEEAVNEAWSFVCRHVDVSQLGVGPGLIHFILASQEHSAVHVACVQQLLDNVRERGGYAASTSLILASQPKKRTETGYGPSTERDWNALQMAIVKVERAHAAIGQGQKYQRLAILFALLKARYQGARVSESEVADETDTQTLAEGLQHVLLGAVNVLASSSRASAAEAKASTAESGTVTMPDTVVRVQGLLQDIAQVSFSQSRDMQLALLQAYSKAMAAAQGEACLQFSSLEFGDLTPVALINTWSTQGTVDDRKADTTLPKLIDDMLPMAVRSGWTELVTALTTARSRLYKEENAYLKGASVHARSGAGEGQGAGKVNHGDVVAQCFKQFAWLSMHVPDQQAGAVLQAFAPRTGRSHFHSFEREVLTQQASEILKVLHLEVRYLGHVGSSIYSTYCLDTAQQGVAKATSVLEALLPQADEARQVLTAAVDKDGYHASAPKLDLLGAATKNWRGQDWGDHKKSHWGDWIVALCEVGARFTRAEDVDNLVQGLLRRTCKEGTSDPDKYTRDESGALLVAILSSQGGQQLSRPSRQWCQDDKGDFSLAAQFALKLEEHDLWALPGVEACLLGQVAGMVRPTAGAGGVAVGRVPAVARTDDSSLLAAMLRSDFKSWGNHGTSTEPVYKYGVDKVQCKAVLALIERCNSGPDTALAVAKTLAASSCDFKVYQCYGTIYRPTSTELTQMDDALWVLLGKHPDVVSQTWENARGIQRSLIHRVVQVVADILSAAGRDSKDYAGIRMNLIQDKVPDAKQRTRMMFADRDFAAIFDRFSHNKGFSAPGSVESRVAGWREAFKMLFCRDGFLDHDEVYRLYAESNASAHHERRVFNPYAAYMQKHSSIREGHIHQQADLSAWHKAIKGGFGERLCATWLTQKDLSCDVKQMFCGEIRWAEEWLRENPLSTPSSLRDPGFREEGSPEATKLQRSAGMNPRLRGDEVKKGRYEVKKGRDEVRGSSMGSSSHVRGAQKYKDRSSKRTTAISLPLAFVSAGLALAGHFTMISAMMWAGVGAAGLFGVIALVGLIAMSRSGKTSAPPLDMPGDRGGAKALNASSLKLQRSAMAGMQRHPAAREQQTPGHTSPPPISARG